MVVGLLFRFISHHANHERLNIFLPEIIGENDPIIYWLLCPRLVEPGFQACRYCLDLH